MKRPRRIGLVTAGVGLLLSACGDPSAPPIVDNLPPRTTAAPSPTPDPTNVSPSPTTPPPPTGDVPPTDPPGTDGVDPQDIPIGFDVLDVLPGSLDGQVGTDEVVFAGSAADFEALWDNLAPGEPPPVIDFEAQFIVAQTVGGSGSCREFVSAVNVDGDGDERRLTLTISPTEPQGACTADLQIRTHVVAVDALDIRPGAVTVGGEPAEVPLATRRSRPRQEQPNGALIEIDTVPLPPPGAITSMILVDGTPVWIVAHEDANVSVLEAVASVGSNTFLSPPAPLQQLVRWHPNARRFVGPDTWDEYGRPLLGRPERSLIRRLTAVEGGVVSIGQPDVNPPVGRPIRDLPPGAAPLEQPAPLPELGRAITIEDLVERRNASALVSDALVEFVTDGVSTTRLCSVDPNGRFVDLTPCPETAPLGPPLAVAPDLAPPAAPATGYLTVYYGPLYVTLTDGEVTSVALLSSGSSGGVWPFE